MNWIRFFTICGVVALLAFQYPVSGIFFTAHDFFPVAQAAGNCDLNFSFTTLNGNVATAGAMNYELVSKNVGTGTCTSASISVYYAANEAFVSSSLKAIDGYYWQFGNLSPGQEIDISLSATRSAPLATGDSTSEACLSASNGADACAFAQISASPTVSSTSTLVATSTTTTTSTLNTPTSTPLLITPSSTPINSTDTAREYGIWDWDTPSTVTPTAMKKAVGEIAQGGFNTIYLSIDDYLTIDALSNGVAKQKALASYTQKINDFLADAAAENINVVAEAGWRDWVESGNAWEPSGIMAFVASYNASHAIKFQGIQYDIEPYLLPQYNNDEQGVLTDYVQLVSNLAAQNQGYGLPLELVIPTFYTSQMAWTPPVTVNGITEYTYDHLVRILGELPNSEIMVMAYRNFAAGTNGTIALSQSEITEADKSNVKIVVAQETGNVSPSYVTFYGMTKSALAGQIGLVNQAFASDASFKGIAIDYLEPYLQLH